MMRSLKLIKTLQQQLYSQPKLYNSHVWITPPGVDGLSYLGISEYAKHHFVRLSKLDYQIFPKTAYGITNRQRIQIFIEQTAQRKQKGQLYIAEQMQWQRFEYKRGQPFSTLQTIEFDVELHAPVDMRVVQVQFQCQYSHRLLQAQYYFKVEPLDLSQLALLDSQQKYNSSVKMIL